MTGYRVVLICLLLFVSGLWLRLPGLDRFLTPDEVVWANAAVQYLDAVRGRDWAATNVSGHPGVTTTWAGAAGLVAKWLLARPRETASFPDYLTWVASDPIRPGLLPWLRAPVAILCALGVVALYFLARRLVGEWIALLAAGLISLDPFLLAHGRVLQMDGLMATAIATAWLALLVATQTGRRGYYVLSGLSIGFAVLTKSPALVMGPLMLGWIVLAGWRFPAPLPRRAGRIGRELLWVGVPAVLLLFLLWPALWVTPLAALGRIWGLMTVYGGGGHELGNYWMGRPVSQPGTFFYAVVIALRTTPVTLIGLALLLFRGVRSTNAFQDARVLGPSKGRGMREGSRFGEISTGGAGMTERGMLSALLVFVLWFGVILSLGAKKFDRYLLPVFPALDLLAAMGWADLARWLLTRLRGSEVGGGLQQRPTKARPALAQRTVLAAGLVLLVGAQAWMAFASRPSYLTSYNPLAGGARVAARAMLVGWGEGLAEAAEFLNSQSDAANTRVAAWYGKNVFGTFFDGDSFDLYYDTPTARDLFANDIDYVVTYVNQMQRALVDPSVLGRLAAPRFTASVGALGGLDSDAGVPWAQVYAWPKPFPHTADRGLAEGLRLLGWDMVDPSGAFDAIPVTLYWDTDALHTRSGQRVLLWMKDATGEVWATSEDTIRAGGGENVLGWLDQPVTATLFVLRPPVGLAAGVYRVEMAAFAGPSAELTELEVPPTRLADVEAFGADTQVMRGEVRFGEEVQLIGYELKPTADTWVLDLLWASLAPSAEARHFFVHLVDESGSGRILSQADGPLVRFDAAGELVRQRVHLSVPDERARADDRIYVGLYRPVDGARLPLTVHDEPLPDGRYLLWRGP